MNHNSPQHLPNQTKRRHLLLFIGVIILIFSGCFSLNSIPSNTTFDTLSKNRPVYDSTEDDTQTAKLINPYKAKMSAEMNTYIATVDSPFSNAFFIGNLGRLAADYMLLTANKISEKEFGIPCHFAISNNGGFRTGLYPGPITLQQLYEVMPFENELVLVQISGKDVDSLFQYIAKLQGTPAAGFEMVFKKGTTRQQNRYLNVKLNSQPIHSVNDLLSPSYTEPLDTRRDYLIAVNSYMAVGGDGFTMLKNAKKIHYTGINLRTILSENLKAEYDINHFIEPRKKPRIYHESR